MLAEIGGFLLALAFGLSLLQAGVLMPTGAQLSPFLRRAAIPAAVMQFALVALAFGVLTILHAVSDFSVLNVAENSHTAKPFIYKITGVWGNHEGSMLLWILILSGFGGVLAARLLFAQAAPDVTPDQVRTQLNLDLKTITLSVQGLVAAAFLAFLIFTSNPFARLSPAPLNGVDLNPLLQDKGLIFHPPFLLSWLCRVFDCVCLCDCGA